jgi:hypothetical protein
MEQGTDVRVPPPFTIPEFTYILARPIHTFHKFTVLQKSEDDLQTHPSTFNFCGIYSINALDCHHSDLSFASPNLHTDTILCLKYRRLSPQLF